jgi:hypothetical protein
LHEGGGEVVGGRIDRRIGPEGDGEIPLLGGRRRRNHATRPERLRQLNRERPHSAGPGNHHDGLPFGELRRRPEQVPRGQSLHEQSQRGPFVEAVRNRVDGGLVRHRVLGVATHRHHRDDPAAVIGRSRHLAAEHERRLELGQVGVLALVRVREVHPRARHLDQHLAVARLRLGQVDDLEHLRPPEFLDLHGSHAAGTLSLASAAA